MTTTVIDQSFLQMQQDIIGRNLGYIEGFFAQVPGLQNSALAVGKAAIAVKEALPHGQFGKWVDTHFPGAHSKINACVRFTIQATEGKFGSLPNIHDINAIKLLTSAKTSDDIREKVVRGEIAPTEKAIREAREGKKSPEEVFYSAFKTFYDAYSSNTECAEALLDVLFEELGNRRAVVKRLDNFIAVLEEARSIAEED